MIDAQEPSAARAAANAPPRPGMARTGTDRRARLALLVLGAIALAGILAVQISNAITARDDAERATLERLDHLTRVTELRVRESLRAVELTLLQIEEYLDAGSRREAEDAAPVLVPLLPEDSADLAWADAVEGRVQTFLRRRRDLGGHLHRLSVFGRDGALLADSRFDRAEIAAVRAGRRAGPALPDAGRGVRVRVGAPSVDLDTGLTVLPVARRVSASGPARGGSVVAAVDPNHLVPFLRAVDPAGTAAEVMILVYDRPLLRLPAAATMPDAARSADFAAALDGESGMFEAPGPDDGVVRTYVYRRVEGHPLAVVLGLDRSATLAPWRTNLMFDVATSVLLAVVVVMLGAMLFGQLRQRDRSERRLAASERHARRLAMVAARTHNGVMIVDETGRIEWVNDGFAGLTGADPAAVVGRDFGAWLAGMTGGTADRFAASRSIDHECRVMQGGAERWLRVQLDPVLEEDGRKRASVAIISDATEPRRLEREAVRAKESAEQASRAKSEFLANMSHELRTPLNAVIGFSEIMCKEMFGALGTAQYREYAHNINASGKHLLALINDILDLSKVEAQKLTLNEDLVDLEALLDEAVAALSVLASSGGVTVARIEGEPTPLVACDQRALRQIMLNLISNAVKFTPEGGTVRAGLRQAADGSLDLTVSDTGIGIPEDALPRIMQPFEQVQSGFARDKPGTGLGLALTRKLVELHGGTIAIASRPGEGTAVTVTLPAERVQAAQVLELDAAD